MAQGYYQPQCGGFVSPVAAGATVAATLMLVLKTGQFVATAAQGDYANAGYHSTAAVAFGLGALYGLYTICPPQALFAASDAEL